jgi:hypothetical protein
MIAYAIAAMLLMQSSPQQFDLNCTGITTTTREQGGRVTQEPVAYAKRFRIDLLRGAWCDGDCRVVYEFLDVSPTQIVLDRQSRGRAHTDVSINRTTGRLTDAWRADASNVSVDTLAICNRTTFTPIPQARF